VGFGLGAQGGAPLDPAAAGVGVGGGGNITEPRQLEECPFTLNMMDSYGDGWNGAKWTWTEDSTNADAETGTLEGGSSGTASLCGFGCYTLSVDQGSFPNEVSWTILKGDTGREEADGGSGDSATVCGAAQPSPQPTLSPVPTVSLQPTQLPSRPVPTTSGVDVSTFWELSNSITSGAQINVVSDIAFTASITISAKTNVVIRSSTGAVLTGGTFSADEGGLFHIKDASDVTFTGLGFKSGSVSSKGGCLFAEGSNVEVEDVDFTKCIAVSSLIPKNIDISQRKYLSVLHEFYPIPFANASLHH